MCVSISVDDVLSYVFSENREGRALETVDPTDICCFCRDVRKAVVGHSNESPHYKYVYFDFDERAIAEFASRNAERYRFVRGAVRLVGEASPAGRSRVEEKYGTVVARAFASAAETLLRDANVRIA